MVRINLEDIQRQLNSGKTIEEIVAEFDWREFEGLVAEIFKAHGFFVRKNLRFKTTRRYEIDVFAANTEIAFAADCKEWSKGRYKISGLKAAVENQENRVKHLQKFLKSNPIARRGLKIEKQEIKPLVVTWLQEDLQKHYESLIVPVWKLNTFLLQTESFSPTE